MARSTTASTVRVEGLDAFRKELATLGKEWPKALGKANQQAAEVVAVEARQKAMGLGGVHRHVAPSIKAAAQARQAVISTGGPQHPAAWGAEFGSKRFAQFPPWRGNQWQPDSGGVGYALHPAIRETRDEFVNTYDAAVRRLAAQAFPD